MRNTEELWKKVEEILISENATMAQAEYVKNRLEAKIEDKKRTALMEMPYRAVHKTTSSH